MISAEEARFRSTNQKAINDILTNLEKEIIKESENGFTSASIDISLNTNKDVREAVIIKLKELGYKVSISDFYIDEKGVPSDQSHWYDEIKVTW